MALSATCLAVAGGSAPERAAAAAGGRPNVIVLLTDDQENLSMKVMKIVNKEMKQKGVAFKRYYTNFPLCCPSRTTMLTGEYAHNHGVLSNQAPDGGYGVFNELHGNDYLPLWLQAAGYRTSYIGKFLNEYAEPDDYGTLPRDVPAGWNDWHVLAPSKAEYFNYTLNENGTLNSYGDTEEQYSTTVFTNKAKRFIRNSGANPFYLMLGYAAPHGGGGGSPGVSCNRGARPDPEDLGALKNKKKPVLPPSFNEADVSDKPSPVAGLPPMTPGQISDTLRKRRCAWESLLAVDRSVGEILDELQKDGVRRNTYIFFTSDNGFLRGEHRIKSQKRYIYEESARVPFIVRGPGVARNEVSNDVVTNADVVPTILDLTGASPGNEQDGVSLTDDFANPKLEHGRAILEEAYAGQTILGLRTSRYLYAEWDTGISLLPERELYDTYADPYELNNLARDPAYSSLVNQLSSELHQLKDCRGVDCHVEETAQMSFASAGPGPNGCSLEPVVAQLTAPDENQITSVEFRVDGALAGVDTTVPFEVTLPYKALRAALPDPAQVVGRAV
ncbi:MAG: sulfatase-like hydrolase/transferase, partial [Solirubrobacterales bacterium]